MKKISKENTKEDQDHYGLQKLKIFQVYKNYK